MPVKTPRQVTPRGEERITIGGGDVMVFDSTASTYHVQTPTKRSKSHHDDHEMSVSSTMVPPTQSHISDVHPTHTDAVSHSVIAPQETHAAVPAEPQPQETAEQPQDVYEVVMIEEEEPSGNYSIIVRSAAEFLATLLFVFVGVLQAGTWYPEPYEPSNADTNENSTAVNTSELIQGVHRQEVDDVLHSALTHGLAIFVLASSFSAISGGHVNPAVTFGLAIARKVDPLSAICYIVSQLVGGFAGAGLTRAILNKSTLENVGFIVVSVDYRWYHALVGEAVATFVLVLVVLMACSESESPLAAAAVGISITVGIFSLGRISGGSLNPARSLGPHAIGAFTIDVDELPDRYWIDHWVYYVGPMTGSGLAAGMYKLFLSSTRIVLP